MTRFSARWPKHLRQHPTKHGNEVITTACSYGFSHRSKLEASVCALIHLRERAGELEHLGHEVHVLICGPEGHACSNRHKIQYIADFKCRLIATDEQFFIEAKGFETEIWRMKRRLWLHYGAGMLEVWAGTYQRPRLAETIQPEGVAP